MGLAAVSFLVLIIPTKSFAATFIPTGWGTSPASTPSSIISFPNPELNNVWTIGTPSATVEADKIAVDTSASPSGNIYYAGVISATTQAFNPDGIDDVQTATTSAVYLTKINADGSYGYTRLIDGATSISISGLKTDGDGNVYLLGRFIGTVNFNPLGADSRSTGPDAQTFLTKISSDGTYDYTYTWPDIGIYISDFSIASDNSLILGGTVSDDTSGSNLNPTGGEDEISSTAWGKIFYLKLNSNGSYAYSKIASTSGSINLNNIAVDSNNNVLILGSFDTDLTNFDATGAAYLQTATGDAEFIDKFDSGGNFVDSYIVDSGIDNDIVPINFGIDQSNNLYIFGDFSGTVNFDPTGGVDYKTSSTDTVRFLSKINNDGTYGYTLTWDNNNFTANKITFDSDGNAYLLGNSSGSTNFSPTGGVPDIPTNLGGNDNFMTVLFPDGDYDYTYTWGGAEDDYVNDAMFDGNSLLHIVGDTTSQSSYYDPVGGQDTTALKGTRDAFIMSFAPQVSNSNSGSNSNSSSSPPSSGVPGPVSCTNPIPTAPSIFQIWATNNQATIYFVPTRDPQDSYTISYGLYDDAGMYNVSFPYSDKSGAIPYTINYLTAGSKYYFKVRANNSCMPGEWSNTLSIAVPASASASTNYTYSETANSGGASLGTSGSCSQYTVVPGDSFWAIAQKLWSAGTRYMQIWSANISKFPSLNTSSVIQPGWTLSVGC